MLRRAGVVLLGGHTVRDREIKFGYAVTGAVAPDRIWTNAGARPGDVLLLTKPIGTGIIGTAIKAGRAPAAVVERAVAGMRTLNRAAAEALSTVDVHACTDVTGFGLLGHGSEMAGASGVGLEIEAAAVPAHRRRGRPGGPEPSGRSGHQPRAFRERRRGLSSRPVELVADLLFDPQTSGGLLVAVPAAQAGRALEALAAGGATAARIGRVSSPSAAHLITLGDTTKRPFNSRIARPADADGRPGLSHGVTEWYK